MVEEEKLKFVRAEKGTLECETNRYEGNDGAPVIEI